MNEWKSSADVANFGKSLVKSSQYARRIEKHLDMTLKKITQRTKSDVCGKVIHKQVDLLWKAKEYFEKKKSGQLGLDFKAKDEKSVSVGKPVEKKKHVEADDVRKPVVKKKHVKLMMMRNPSEKKAHEGW